MSVNTAEDYMQIGIDRQTSEPAPVGFDKLIAERQRQSFQCMLIGCVVWVYRALNQLRQSVIMFVEWMMG